MVNEPKGRQLPEPRYKAKIVVGRRRRREDAVESRCCGGGDGGVLYKISVPRHLCSKEHLTENEETVAESGH